MLKRTLSVGDEFRKGLIVVRVVSVVSRNRCVWEWIVYSDGSSREVPHRGSGSHSKGLSFFEGEGFTYHPVNA